MGGCADGAEGGTPGLRFLFSEGFRTFSDINGNIQPVKTTDPRNRIDGAVSLIIAHKGFLDVRDQYINLNEGTS